MKVRAAIIPGAAACFGLSYVCSYCCISSALRYAITLRLVYHATELLMLLSDCRG